MSRKRIFIGLGIGFIFLISSCSVPPSMVARKENKTVPSAFLSPQDTLNTGKLKWKEFFSDPYLSALIDTALKNNQELNIITQEINIANNEVLARKGQYLPFLNLEAGSGVERSARYTRDGAVDANTEIMPGKKIPDPLSNHMIAAVASWEIDVWGKLHNAKKSAVANYLASVEGRKFMITNLVAEIASSYYELLALDNQLDMVKKNIDIQSNALEIVKLQKEATRVTELAVRKFEAEVLHTKSLQYDIQQRIVETENTINFLIGRFPQPIQRNSLGFIDMVPDTIHGGIPSQLLENRPDIKQAEQQLIAAKLDVKVAKANFYPSLVLTAGIGYQAFNPKYLISPESMLYSMAGGLVAPLINRNAIKAEYYSANSKQIQAVYHYEQTILRAHIEVINQLSNISNLEKSYDLKSKQVQALTQAIDISTTLFKSARADYMEVLLTQRDALDSKFELVETKMEQMNARVNIYRALGGGWN
ncbi:MAG: TolC family protein [Flavobacteriales bacterium]